jgi:2,6-dihydroxypyridine 3-monooxygenase
MTFSSWNALFRLLYGALGSTPYHLGSQVVDFEVDSDEARVVLSDGRKAAADLVVFADGIASTGRALFAPRNEPAYAGYIVWRGCVPAADVAPRQLELFESAHTTCLLDHSHMNTYLVPAPGAVGKCGARMLNYVWYRNVAEGELEELLVDSHGESRSISVPPGLVQERLADELRKTATAQLPPAAAEIVVKTSRPFLQVIYDIEVEQMAFERACLVGDAAFLARPHLGAGTAKAAENAWALADAIDVSQGDVATALELWEPSELSLGKTLVARAKRVGDRLQLEGSVVPGDPQHRADIQAPLRTKPGDPNSARPTGPPPGIAQRGSKIGASR